MAVKFKVIKRIQLGVPEVGIKKFYAAPVFGGGLTLAGFTKSLEKNMYS